MAQVERLTVYPVKALDGMTLREAEITRGGTLVGDREFAMVDTEGEPVNGKRTDRVHDLRTAFDPIEGVLTVRVDDDADHMAGERHGFDLVRDPASAEDWLSEYFGVEVTLRQDTETGYVDRRSAGPSVISTATLEEVAGWYDDVTVDGLRRRLRANVEISGVEPFWEDRFLGEDAPSFTAGGVRFEGVEPCGRCVVPERDPDTGERDPEFRSRFVQRRRETLPEFVDEGAFDHFYAVMLIASIPEADRDGVLRVGDPVRIVE